MRPILFSTLLASFLWSAPIGGVAILVKNSPITLHEIEVEMKQSGLNATQSSDVLIRKKLEQLEANEKKISVTPVEIQEELERMAKQNNLSMEQFLDAMKTVRGLSETDLKSRVEENIKGQKLYNAVAFSKMGQPTAEEEADYYQLHIDEFSHADRYDVTAYFAPSQEALQAKISDPMRHIDAIQSKDESFAHGSINPQLAQILNKLQAGQFSPILPNGKNGFVAFYLKEKQNVTLEPLDSIRPQIANAIMGEKRNQVLNDYFTRLRLSADIKVLRLPQ